MYVYNYPSCIMLAYNRYVAIIVENYYVHQSAQLLFDARVTLFYVATGV